MTLETVWKKEKSWKHFHLLQHFAQTTGNNNPYPSFFLGKWSLLQRINLEWPVLAYTLTKLMLQRAISYAKQEICEFLLTEYTPAIRWCTVKLEALERLYRSTGLIFLQWQKKFLTIIIQSLHFSSLKKKGMEKTCEKRRKKW